MRVIAGKARRLPLKTIEGDKTRPTTDRIKETLFNMLQYSLSDCLFLDLFSGSGAMAIEALSRGARQAWLVENQPNACQCIKDNLKTTSLDSQAQVMAMDVIQAIDHLDRQKITMDIIFMDPPYGQLLEKNVLTRLSETSLVDTYTTVIIEADLNTDFSYVDTLGFQIIKEKKYKTNQHVFLKKHES